MNYADALTKEGKFFGAAATPTAATIPDESSAGDAENVGTTLTASIWKQAYDEWMGLTERTTHNYGKYQFLGLDNHKYMLNSSDAELDAMAKTNGIDIGMQRRVWTGSVDMVHYRYWRDFAETEGDPVTIEAHKAFFDAKKAYAEGQGYIKVLPDGTNQISEAQRLLEISMNRWLEASAKYPKFFIDHSAYLEEAMLTTRYWKAVHQNSGTTEAVDYPLKAVWESNADMHLEIDRMFLQESRGRKK
jgi:hypothetical protein